MLDINWFIHIMGSCTFWRYQCSRFKMISCSSYGTVWSPWLHTNSQLPPMWSSSYSRQFHFFSNSYNNSKLMYSCMVQGHPLPSPQQFMRDTSIYSFCIHYETFSLLWRWPPCLYKNNTLEKLPLWKVTLVLKIWRTNKEENRRNDDALSALQYPPNLIH